jgi:hypothetical protein
VRAQSCCAAPAPVTPARLAANENVLVGAQLRGSVAFGSYDRTGSYLRAPAGSSEQDFEQDLFVAARVAGRGQVALVLPFVETRRVTAARGGQGDLGGGVGDVNVSARYDFLYQNRFRYVPGIALLAGATMPTGRAPERTDLARHPLAADATGIGAVQLHLALALEKGFGPVLVSATALVAQRVPRRVEDVEEQLAAQWTALVSASYGFENGAALALAGSFWAEGDATVDGAAVPDSGRRLFTITASAVLPLARGVRMHGGLFFTPPASQLGRNQSAVAGASLTSVLAWR